MFNKRVWLIVVTMLLSSVAYAQDWQKDPIVADTHCLNVSGKQVLGFVAKYYIPALVFSSDRDKAEKELFQSYVMSAALLTRSQYCLVDALGIQGVTEDLKKQQTILTSGTSFEDKKLLKEHRKLSEKVDKKINRALAKNEQLLPEQKKVFAVGSALYGGATYTFIELNKAYGDYFGDSAKEAGSLFGKAKSNSWGAATGFLKKAGTVTVIGKGITTLWPMTVGTGKDIYKYSQKNDIEIDNDIADKVGW